MLNTGSKGQHSIYQDLNSEETMIYVQVNPLTR